MKGFIAGSFLCSLAFASMMSHACGPSFPNSYLINGEEAKILALPRSNFYLELLSMVPGALEKPSFDEKWKNWDFYYPKFYDKRIARNSYNNNPLSAWEKTLLADIGDLQKSLIAKGKSQAECERILGEYRTMREAMKALIPSPEYDADFPSPPYEPLKPFDLTPYQSILDEMNKEFVLYTQGAAAYRTNDFQGAERYWNELLQLPETERHYRSTWASFMLGKIALIDNPTKAIDRFETTRKLVAKGFSDSIRTATASIGWQAKAELAMGKFREAIQHYWYLFDTGYEPYIQYVSLNRVCSKVLSSTEPIPAEYLSDALCRKITSAWIRSYRRNNSGFMYKRWLGALRDNNIQLEPGEIDILAWSAYQKGDIEDAKHWLALNPSLGPDGKWVQSKLLLREGKIEEAMEILRSLIGTFDVTDGDNVLAELGVLYMGRRQFVEAMDAFLRCGYWQDAAYVAERILTLDELDTYIKEHQNDTTLLEKDRGSWRGIPLGERLNYLYARRLARANRWEDAIPRISHAVSNIAQNTQSNSITGYDNPLFSPEIISTAQNYAEHHRQSSNSKVSKRNRAEHLFKAAMILREYGMELTGSEQEPDWTYYEGNYQLPGATGHRLRADFDPQLPTDARNIKPFLSASPAEIERASQSLVDPFKRFHYRYLAVDMMWNCAKMLPNNDPLTAKALYYGGLILANRDPAGADRFYKALVKRCRKLPIGKQADEARWFPKNPEFDTPKRQ